MAMVEYLIEQHGSSYRFTRSVPPALRELYGYRTYRVNLGAVSLVQARPEGVDGLLPELRKLDPPVG